MKNALVTRRHVVSGSLAMIGAAALGERTARAQDL
jgi:hypothetical protein